MTQMRDEARAAPETKVGVYVCCCGGNISDEVDVEAVCRQTLKIPGVVVARSNMFMCSDPGQDLIVKDLQEGLVDRVVVASCAPSLHETTFRRALVRAGVNPYLYEHANLREHVSWVHHGREATDKATRLVAAAAARAGLLRPLDPVRVGARRHATVIGGGISGLRAALDLAEMGFEVTLIEKSPFLGGRVARLGRLAPDGEDAAEVVGELALAVLRHPAVTIHTCARVSGFEGHIGNFRLRGERRPPENVEYMDALGRAGGSGKGPGDYVPLSGLLPSAPPETPGDITVETGVVLLATGFQPYRPRRGEYGFGDLPQVVTLPEFLKALAEAPPAGGGTLVFAGRPIRRVAMIHCVGSRQIPGIHEENEEGCLNEYCSRTCCAATLFAARDIRRRYPQTRVLDFHRDIRTYGRGQEELYTGAARDGVLFLRFDAESPPEIIRGDDSSDYPLHVRVRDLFTFGEEVVAPVDLAVLAVGQEPSDVADLARMMKIPVGADRYLQEVHPKLRPVETTVGGILLAGACQAPFDTGEACASGAAAAGKASALLGRGYAELDPFVAEVDPEKCVGTGACVAACLRDGALHMVERAIAGRSVRRAEVNPALCQGCGACVAVCPENAIDIKGWTLRQYEAMVDMIVSEACLD